MLSWITRSLSIQNRKLVNNCSIVNQYATKILNTTSPTISRRSADQIEYIKSTVAGSNLHWPSIKSYILDLRGQINQKNFEGVLLRILINNKNFEAAVSFAEYLKSSSNEMNLGSTNGLLRLYYEIGLIRTLSDEEKSFILDTYKRLYEQYKVLDYSICEKLIRALCVIDEYEKALKVLEDIYLSSVPSHTAYSIIIGTLFRKNQKKKALELVKRSIEDKRPLQYLAFNEWINYIFRKYKNKETILKYLDEIYLHISINSAVIDEQTANKLKSSFESLGWNATFTRIKKMNGQCSHCNDKLDQLLVSDEEFISLQKIIKDKLIVGSDLFLKTSPEELKRFLNFVERTAPYDIVIDALNVGYSVGQSSPATRLSTLLAVVDHFKKQNKRILVLGRKHMLKWGKMPIQKLISNTCSFFTDNISEDDPYFITAAILSGPNTDIVSKDLLRGHKFLLQDEQLRYAFRRWQWQHQWMVYQTVKYGLKIQAPLSFTPCAQKKNSTWHLPYEREVVRENASSVNDGTPDLTSWLCIMPKRLDKEQYFDQK